SGPRAARRRTRRWYRGPSISCRAGTTAPARRIDGGGRGAPGCTPGAPNVWGVGGPFEAPHVLSLHGFAGATRTLGGLRGPARRGTPRLRRGGPSVGGPRASRGATASPGRPERLGGLGGPARRGAPRLRRGDPSGWGVWGPRA